MKDYLHYELIEGRHFVLESESFPVLLELLGLKFRIRSDI